jgi:D-alanyl-D-alanine carboxypeptidase
LIVLPTSRPVRRPHGLALLLLLLVFAAFGGRAWAEPGFRADRFGVIAIDADSGRTLYARAADARRYPASLTKVMTLYIAFDEIDRGRLRMNDRIVVSRHAAAQPPTKIGLRPGSSLTVREAIDLIVVKSANDVAVALAERIAGSEPAFARRMNRKARAIGMRHTHFVNASGLPNRKQTTTARDLARLGRSLLRRHPQAYAVFAKRQTTFRGRRIRGHNHLLKNPEIDGIKTGYTRASGFNLMTSGVHDDHRVIAVVLGGDTARRRDNYMRKLIQRCFAKMSAQDAPRREVASAERPAPRTEEPAAPQAAAGKETSDAAAGDEVWWVQVGAFKEQARAWTRLADLAERHPKRFGDAPRGVDQPGSLYQARFNVFSEKEARDSCAILRKEGDACFWFAAGAG